MSGTSGRRTTALMKRRANFGLPELVLGLLCTLAEEVGILPAKALRPNIPRIAGSKVKCDQNRDQNREGCGRTHIRKERDADDAQRDQRDDDRQSSEYHCGTGSSDSAACRFGTIVGERELMPESGHDEQRVVDRYQTDHDASVGVMELRSMNPVATVIPRLPIAIPMIAVRSG